jgi:hypothetical protein
MQWLWKFEWLINTKKINSKNCKTKDKNPDIIEVRLEAPIDKKNSDFTINDFAKNKINEE